MKRQSLIVALFIIICKTLGAERISEFEAVAIAQKFMPEKVFSDRSLSRSISIPLTQDQDQAFYAINAHGNDGGFVIIDSNTSEVVGYSYKGTFDPGNMPDNAKALLNSFQIEADESSGYMTIHKNIAPLIQTKWGQRTPFNNLCPPDDGEETPSGCLATAMAQILYYCRPVSSEGIPGYNGYEALPATSFNWDAMQLEYDGTETGQSADAVAMLMRYCGQAVETNYTKTGSWAAFKDDVFSKVFGLSKSDVVLYRASFDTKTWEELIYKELAELRPVLYTGFSPIGHFFVVDGYENREGKGYFHINFGWNGMSDGYYSLSSAGGYCLEQYAFVGLQQDHGEDETLRLIIDKSSVSFTAPVYYRADPLDSFKGIGVNGTFRSIHFTNPTEVNVGWGLFDGLDLIEVLSADMVSINNDYFHGYVLDKDLNIGAHISNGNYAIRQIWHPVEDSEWRLMASANSRYIKVCIEDNKLFLELSSPEVYELVMNKVSYSGSMRRSKVVELIANITNNSDRGSAVPVYLFEDDNLNSVCRGCVYAERGQSEDVVFSYTPETIGSILLKFATDYLGENVFHTEPVNISEGLKEELSCKIDIKDLDMYSLYNDSLKAIVHLENPWDVDYDDGIIVSLSWGENFSERIDSIVPLKLSKGETYDIVITMPLEKGTSYSFGLLQYHYYDTYCMWNPIGSEFFTCYGTEPKVDALPLNGDANGDGIVDAADIEEVKSYIMGSPSDKFNIENADANSDGSVNASDIVTIVNVICIGANKN